MTKPNRRAIAARLRAIADLVADVPDDEELAEELLDQLDDAVQQLDPERPELEAPHGGPAHINGIAAESVVGCLAALTEAGVVDLGQRAPAA